MSGDKSNQEIADQLFLALNSVKAVVAHIYRKLGVDNRRSAVSRAKELGLLEKGAPINAPKHNLPVQMTSFIGRQDQVSQAKGLLRQHALVTLTGSGGVGKTRLALQVAEKMVDQYADGVWLVELTAVTNPDMVTQAVASVLGLNSIGSKPIHEILLDYLQHKQAILVLDNCEHLIDTCAILVNELLQNCRHLKILATSREALCVVGERPFRVPSLTLPDPSHLPEFVVMEQFEAVSLFIERANAVMPGFKATEKNTPAITRICQRLDGIPLAIELAAARLNMLTTDQLASRLDNAFHLLISGSRTALPRHQTLRATIDWSYDMLSDPERILLRRLSVFAGGCSMEAAESVCTGNGIIVDEILDLLSSLANKSILQAERKQGEETRYRLLETVRQYAREKLFDARESASTRDRHLEYFLDLAEQAEPQLRSQGRLEWSQRLRTEMDNLRSALEWAYQPEGDPQKGLRLVTAIGFRFLTPNGYLADAIEWVMKGLELSQTRAVEPILQARAYNLLAEIYENQRNFPAVFEWVQKSLPILRQLGPTAYPDLAWALWDYSLASQFQHNHNLQHSHNQQEIEALDESIRVSRQMGSAGDWYLGMSLFVRSMREFDENVDLAYQLTQESRQAFNRSGDRWSVMIPLHQLGIIVERREDLPQALQYFQESLLLADEIGDRPSLSYNHIHLGRILRKMGDYPTAIQHHLNYVRLWSTMGNLEALREGFVNLGLDWFCLGNRLSGPAQQAAYRRAALLISFAEKQRSSPYSFLFDPELFNQVGDTCRRAWGETEYQQVWKQGQNLTLDEALKIVETLPVTQSA